LPQRILVVDDEIDLVNLVAFNLRKAGFEVITAFDGTMALQQVWDHLPDLIILDLMLPDHSGFDICRDIKQRPETRHIPVILLTARSAEQDRITGFEIGAEDYVVKPFSPKELVLRAKALLARTQPQEAAGLSLGPITLHADLRQVLINGQAIILTSLEFELLAYLMRHPEKVTTREQLLKKVWKQQSEEVMDRTVDAHIKRLRGKLGSARDHLHTVRGMGYRLSKTPTTSVEGG
jgi:two-component system, OmpR family, phosphate regulon response regulator PhoB